MGHLTKKREKKRKDVRVAQVTTRVNKMSDASGTVGESPFEQ